MDFGAMLATWRNVLFRPGEATFTEEILKPQARLTTAIIWIIIAAVISAIFGAIGAVIASATGGGMAALEQMLGPDVPPELVAQMTLFTNPATWFCLTLILTPLMFFLNSAILFVLARLLGGTGSFELQTYLLSTFSAPLVIAAGVISIIPFLGGCLGLLLSIYQLVLTYFAIKVSHTLTSGRAVAVVLIPVLLVLLCAICAAAVGVMGVISAAGDPRF